MLLLIATASAPVTTMADAAGSCSCWRRCRCQGFAFREGSKPKLRNLSRSNPAEFKLNSCTALESLWRHAVQALLGSPVKQPRGLNPLCPASSIRKGSFDRKMMISMRAHQQTAYHLRFLPGRWWLNSWRMNLPLGFRTSEPHSSEAREASEVLRSQDSHKRGASSNRLSFSVRLRSQI